MPDLDEEMIEFVQWLAMRHSEGTDKIFIAKFIEVFGEDYCIDSCPAEDAQPFDPSKFDTD